MAVTLHSEDGSITYKFEFDDCEKEKVEQVFDIDNAFLVDRESEIVKFASSDGIFAKLKENRHYIAKQGWLL